VQQAAGRKPVYRAGFRATYLREPDRGLLAPPARCSKPPHIWLIAQAAAASRSRHCSGLIHADRLRDEASDLGETGLQVGLAARRVLLGTPFFLHVPK
jgi:hypothetical protein